MISEDEQYGASPEVLADLFSGLHLNSERDEALDANSQCKAALTTKNTRCRNNVDSCVDGNFCHIHVHLARGNHCKIKVKTTKQERRRNPLVLMRHCRNPPTATSERDICGAHYSH